MHPLYETLIKAKDQAEQSGLKFINLREAFNNFSQEDFAFCHPRPFRWDASDFIKVLISMLGGIFYGFDKNVGSFKVLSGPVMRLGLLAAVYSSAMQYATPAGIYSQLLNSEGGERFAAQERFTKRYDLEAFLFCLIVLSSFSYLPIEGTVSDIRALYNVESGIITARNIGITALESVYRLVISYAQYWKISTTVHLLYANRKRYFGDLKRVLRLPVGLEKCLSLLLLVMLIPGALYPFFFKMTAFYELPLLPYYGGATYFLYRKIEGQINGRATVARQNVRDPYSWWIGLSNGGLFLTMAAAFGKILEFTSFSLRSLLMVHVGEQAMVSELKKCVSESAPILEPLPMAQNLFRLKPPARVEVLPEAQSQDMQNGPNVSL